MKRCSMESSNELFFSFFEAIHRINGVKLQQNCINQTAVVINTVPWNMLSSQVLYSFYIVGLRYVYCWLGATAESLICHVDIFYT